MEKIKEKCCVGYARVSTEEQAREGVSLDNQIRKIELYAELNGLNLIDVIVDEGISAKNLNRPGVQRVLEMVKKEQISCIVIYKLDRMYRSTIDALRTSKMLDKKGVALHSINEKLDTKSAMGKFFFTLLSSIAELEANITSERTIDSLQHKSRRMEKTGGSVPYGYDVEMKDNLKMLVPNEYEQQILVRIKNLRAAGMSFRAIATELEAQGIKTKKGKSKWHHEVIRHILVE